MSGIIHYGPGLTLSIMMPDDAVRAMVLVRLPKSIDTHLLSRPDYELCRAVSADYRALIRLLGECYPGSMAVYHADQELYPGITVAATVMTGLDGRTKFYTDARLEQWLVIAFVLQGEPTHFLKPTKISLVEPGQACVVFADREGRLTIPPFQFTPTATLQPSNSPPFGLDDGYPSE